MDYFHVLSVQDSLEGMTRSCTNKSINEQQTPATEPQHTSHSGLGMVDELMIQLIRKQILKSPAFQH